MKTEGEEEDHNLQTEVVVECTITKTKDLEQPQEENDYKSEIQKIVNQFAKDIQQIEEQWEDELVENA